MKPQHFLELTDFSAEDLKRILKEAATLKETEGTHAPYLEKKTLATVFDKRSVRTSCSFFTGMAEMGGQTKELILDDKETIADTAAVLSGYFNAIAIRISNPNALVEFAAHSKVPVINAMTDNSHPCQIMADLLTVQERLGTFEGKNISWFGDFNNVSKTYVQAATIFPSIQLTLAVPEMHQPQDLKLPSNIRFETDPAKAAEDADVVVTDVWTSMGQGAKDEAVFQPYQVNEKLMSWANPSAMFMHCMPMKVGKEVTRGVLDTPQSAVFQEAENRKHAQKAILLYTLAKSGKIPYPRFTPTA